MVYLMTLTKSQPILQGWPNLLNIEPAYDSFQSPRAPNRRQLDGVGVWVQALHAADFYI
jgi:hypothetical protein